MKNKKIAFVFFLGILILMIAAFVSISYGAKSVAFLDVAKALFGGKSTDYNINVVKARIPRTIFGIIAGASLSISGVLMQSITKNPIADPSILGVNSGASLFIVLGITFLNIQSKMSYIAFAFLGAMFAALLVYRLASFGFGGATPIKLALSGSAISIALSSIISMIVMPNSNVMTTYRFWQIGSIGGTSYEDIKLILPITILAIFVSLCMSNSLNTLSLSEETAIALGLNVNRTKIIAAICGVLLCATTTALAGPISFIGLMVPHFVRMLIGSNHAPLIAISGVYGSSILLFSDVLGRVLGRPAELESGIMTALIGAPVFIFLVRKAKVSNL